MDRKSLRRLSVVAMIAGALINWATQFIEEQKQEAFIQETVTKEVKKQLGK